MVTFKKDLIALGFGPSFSADIIRECKKLMISKEQRFITGTCIAVEGGFRE